ncbi:MAG: MCE family protein [Chitinispirillaceae bacterium]|nr:MCE family protein [Chitinispirillaceae bacterium]
MSISKTQRARLGVFVISGVVLLLAFVSVTLGLKLSRTTKTYYAYFEGESLSGLEQGALVKYSGVPVGKVDKITYQPRDLLKVKVRLTVQPDFPMKADMYATTGLMGITGLKYVEVLGGTSAAPLLKNGGEIATRASMFSSISGKAEAIVAKVELLINNLNMLSNPDSLKSLRLLIENIGAITGDVKKLTGTMTPKVDSMTSSAAGIMRKVDRIAGNVQDLTSTIDTAFSAGRITRTISSIDSAAIALKLVADNLSLLVRQSREDFSVSTRNLREASESANQLAKMLAENPSLLIRSGAQKERGLQ